MRALPLIHVSGPRGAGKSLVLRHLLSRLRSEGVNFVWINSEECYSSETLYHLVCRAVAMVHGLNFEAPPCTAEACIAFLATSIPASPSSIDLSSSSTTSTVDSAFYVVFDQAENLRTGCSSCLHIITRLSEYLPSQNLGVIFISHMLWRKLVEEAACPVPIEIFIPHPSTQDMVKIFIDELPPSHAYPALYRWWVERVCDMFQHSFIETAAFRQVIQTHYPRFLESIRDLLPSLEKKSDIPPSALSTLAAKFQQIVKNIAVSPSAAPLSSPLPPVYMWLIVSSWMASFIPESLDLRNFGRSAGDIAKPRKNQKESGKIAVITPKTFKVDRLLAIYAALRGLNELPVDIELQSIIRTLIELNFLNQVSAERSFQNMRLRCNVSRAYAHMLATTYLNQPGLDWDQVFNS